MDEKCEMYGINWIGIDTGVYIKRSTLYPFLCRFCVQEKSVTVLIFSGTLCSLAWFCSAGKICCTNQSKT